MPTLDLMDVTKKTPVRLESVTLTADGKLKYEGETVKDIFATYLGGDYSPRQVFETLTDWSNGYVKLQLKAGE